MSLLSTLFRKVESFEKKLRFWYLSKTNPQKLANCLYVETMGKKEGINWESPRDLNEKINWLKFNTDTQKWSELADKITVREFIKEKGFERYLVPLLGVWENANQIVFSKLPKSFVLKTNNGAGTVMVVEDKSKVNEKEVRAQINKWMKIKFGLKQAEPHYLRIKPLVLAEAVLKEKNPISSSLIDYKIWCFDGKAFATWVCYNRHRFVADTEWHDLDWNYRPEWSIFTDHYKDGHGRVQKPKNYEDMIYFAEQISKDFPQVRVDLYNIEGQIYFGEMTFTSAGGHMNFYSDEVLLEMGQLTKLPTDK